MRILITLFLLPCLAIAITKDEYTRRIDNIGHASTIIIDKDTLIKDWGEYRKKLIKTLDMVELEDLEKRESYYREYYRSEQFEIDKAAQEEKKIKAKKYLKTVDLSAIDSMSQMEKNVLLKNLVLLLGGN